MTNSQSFRLDTSRWTRNDWITGIGSLVLFIALFLPWYGVNLFGISAEADGLTGHGYLYIVLLLCLVIMGYLVAVAGLENFGAGIPLSHQQRLLAATGLNGLLVLLAFALKPAETGWRFGAFAGLLAAIVALAPQALPALASRRAPGALGLPGTHIAPGVPGTPGGSAASGSTPPVGRPATGPDQSTDRFTDR